MSLISFKEFLYLNKAGRERCLHQIYEELQQAVSEPLSEEDINKIQKKLQDAELDFTQHVHSGDTHGIRVFNLLSYAIRAKHIKLIKLLINVGFEKNPSHVEPPLVTATIEGQLDIVKMLQQHGCPSFGLLEVAIRCHQDPITQWLFDNEHYNGSELETAVSEGNEWAIQLLHTKNYVYKPSPILFKDIRNSHNPILYFAIAYGYPKGLKLLLNTGKYVDLNTADKTLGTPLQYATIRKDKECFKILKARINPQQLPATDNDWDSATAFVPSAVKVLYVPVIDFNSIIHSKREDQEKSLNQIYEAIQQIIIEQPLNSENINKVQKKLHELGLMQNVSFIERLTRGWGGVLTRERIFNLLSLAVKFNHSPLINLLINVGFAKNPLPSLTEHPLITAAIERQPDAAKTLRLLGCSMSDYQIDQSINWDTILWHRKTSTPSYPLQLKLLLACITLGAVALATGIITLCLFSALGTGIALTAVGATAFSLSTVGFYKYRPTVQNIGTELESNLRTAF